MRKPPGKAKKSEREKRVREQIALILDVIATRESAARQQAIENLASCDRVVFEARYALPGSFFDALTTHGHDFNSILVVCRDFETRRVV